MFTKEEKKTRRLVTDGIRGEKKGRTRSSEYPKTKVWRKRLQKKNLVVFII